jgi:phosphoribosylamine--glycine ligase
MKVLIIGSGAREHALVWKIAQSPKVEKIWCAPGNPGIADLADCVPINPQEIDKLLEFAKKEAIDLTVVGPVEPLAGGIADRFEKEGLKLFGPFQKAAEIETSKSFAKQLMVKYGIPTAKARIFNDLEDAENYVLQVGAPIVVKADGLAGGKGVRICETDREAIDALDKFMAKRVIGDAGKRVILEERLSGEEASFMVFTDSKTILPLPPSQNHIPLYENDKGPNTEGMGACSPAPVVDSFMHKKIIREIMTPAIRAMAEEGRPYKGILCADLMIDGDKVRVLEFNARFGDPEAQAVLVRVENDIVPVMEAVIEGKLQGCKLDIDESPSACVVMASGGYPETYTKGMPVSGLDEAGDMEEVIVFQGGTAETEEGIVSAGGRVLGVTATGDSLKEAISDAYLGVSEITWDDVYYRRDIGQKALNWLEQVPRVGIVMGSDSDLGVMEETVAALKKFGIPFEITVASAHRSPERAAQFAASAQKRGIRVIVAGAGHAAHLAGVLAAHTILPVIGVPIDSSCLQGFDSLLSTVQMPPGIPVATVAIGKPGARNAGILAAQILALSDPELENQLNKLKKEMAEQVEQKARKIQQ